MKKHVLYCLLLVLFTSCQTLNWISIDVQKPATIALPLSVQNVAIVNNSATQPANVGHKEIFYSKEKDVEVSSDSLNIILTQALAQFMNDEAFFDQVVSYDEPLKENDSFLSESDIDSQKMKQIADATNADAVISLDRLILLSEHTSQNVGNSLSAENLCVKMLANFRIYLVSKDEALPVFVFKDSICWNAVSQNGEYFLDKLPSRTEALKHAALYIADKTVSVFIPFWQQQERWFYNYTNSSPKMKEATLKANNKEWKQAAIIWGELYEEEKNTLKKARLASNIALANEMIDDLENALTWINIASELFISAQTKQDDENLQLNEAYKKELEQRLIDFEKLDSQEGI